MSKQIIYCLVGKSGVGKTTVANYLSKQYGMRQIESYTTRPPRYEGETGHIFVNRKEFDALGQLCAYTEFDGNLYGVPASMVDASDLYVIDVPGIKYLRDHYHGKEIRVIGLCVDENTLYARMVARGDSDAAAEQRIEHDRKQFADMDSVCDIVISAYSVNETVSQVLNFIYQEETKLLKEATA